MVFYFTSSATDPPTLIYMGRDKYENEDLIKYGWEEDVWFHVDNLSSAHVYLRLSGGITWDAIPEALLTDCAQLVKENSIEGCKKAQVAVCYTPWSNLRKTGDMAIGQIGFHDQKKVKLVTVARDTTILNRLKKTKEERTPDLHAERDAHLAEGVRERKRLHKEQLARERDEKERLQKLAENRSYDRVFRDVEAMVSNKDAANLEDDFM